jgi:hypothetical protein
VIPAALVLKQEGDALSGTVSMPTQKIRQTMDVALKDHTLLIYGSPMGDSNLHNHKRVPFFMAGRAGGAIVGGLHLKAPNETPQRHAQRAAGARPPRPRALRRQRGRIQYRAWPA